MGDIKHHIDLVLDVLICQICHIIGPAQRGERDPKGKDGGTSQKGHICESMSSCAVPVPLTPKKDQLMLWIIERQR